MIFIAAALVQTINLQLIVQTKCLFMFLRIYQTFLPLCHFRKSYASNLMMFYKSRLYLINHFWRSTA